jgi:hypothetical protein
VYDFETVSRKIPLILSKALAMRTHWPHNCTICRRYHPEGDCIREKLRAAGWVYTARLLYDEEGIEGWEWQGPGGEEFTVIGDHNSPPALPEELVNRFKV